MTEILFYGCDIGKRVRIRVVEFFCGHRVKILTEREFNTLALPTRNNTAEKRMLSFLDNTVDTNRLLELTKPFVWCYAVKGFAILFIGGGVSGNIYAFDLRASVNKLHKSIELVAEASGVNVNVLIGRNYIDNLAESKKVCHRLAACNYYFGNVERVVISENVLNSIYNTIERGAIFGVFLFAFTEGAVVGAVKRHHNRDGKIVAT
jgi:hypothetical protein